MRLIDADELLEKFHNHYAVRNPEQNATMDEVCMILIKAPTADAVELPKGKPGDYLEWDSGTGYKQIYCIGSVMICDDCIRYELANFAPVANHPNIVRIMSKDEVENENRKRFENYRELKEMKNLFPVVGGENNEE